MHITVIGTGFVGVVSAAVYASFGNTVYGLDIDEKKILALQQAKVPFYEPDLETLLVEQQATGNLHFTTDYEKAVKDADVIIIAVGTPSSTEGAVNLEYVFASCESLAPYLKKDTIIVLKSTVPPGSTQVVVEKIQAKTDVSFTVASVPEFLKEGTAVHDTLHPDRVVIGTDSDDVFKTLSLLHQPLQAPIIKTSIESAQMAKYTANAYLATRITFINEIANLCEHNGADVQEVIKAIGYDKRIGSHYWYPGLGYGGSCFPKDVKEIAAYSRSVNLDKNLFNTINEINDKRIYTILDKLEQQLETFKDKKVALLGLSFKPNTDDMREAPSTKIIPYLLDKGAFVTAYDPKAIPIAQTLFPENERLHYVGAIEDTLIDVDIIMAVIEWQEILSYPFETHQTKINTSFFDARNQFDATALKKAGYNYMGIGR